MKFNTQIRWSCKIFAATQRGVHPSSSQVLTSHLYDIKIMMSLKCSRSSYKQNFGSKILQKHNKDIIM